MGEDFSYQLNIEIFEENQRLRGLIHLYLEKIRVLEKAQLRYRELSHQHQLLRQQLERCQHGDGPLELALRCNWCCPEVLHTLEEDFDERMLEQYLWYQLERIEPGLRFSGHQVPCGGLFLDMVAEDRFGKHVILELKVVEDDPRLLKQVEMYPKFYTEIFGVSSDDVRMMVIAPGYGDEVKRRLRELGVNMVTYQNNAGWLEFKHIH